jgi:hypothetical protein
MACGVRSVNSESNFIFAMAEDPNPAQYDERLQALEADVKDLALLFKHLIDSSPHGEQLLFASLGRIEEQDEAVLRFNETLRDLLRRKGLS